MEETNGQRRTEDDEGDTTMGAAFRKVGIEESADIDTVTQKIKARNIDDEIRGVAKGLPGADSLKKELEALEQLRSEHADLLSEIAQTIALIRDKFPDTRDAKLLARGAGGRFGRMIGELQAKFDEVADRNPLALEEYHIQKDARNKQRREERFAERKSRED